ncbi:SDR family oxidoreductase [Azohydromonas caseinilytica]|uniref:SDR family oxidoreductase n=1 Tax=Azohydromonas caseinilytica TaxID=2728836 RepID=A0A848FG57_9BURK|nr:SDR family oxidoreductase [Azohydromonas caseinilytica]NML17120.1 SDR family oxidoreductase [Azohydromonas caseinilytica]
MAHASFVTGATGFIGKRLVERLLARDEGPVYFLVHPRSLARLDALYARWGVDRSRAVPVPGDLTQPGLGLSVEDAAMLRGRVRHFFHLAALYDLGASAEALVAANVQGTRHAVALAQAIGAGGFHHMSSIAAAGLYRGTFSEDMFEEAEQLDHPYFGTKHEAERIVRTECPLPWRIYRPGIVVGQSDTGEMDKIDGPYYFFKAIQRLRRLLPPWFPAIGLEGGRLNLVPVDFVVNALDELAHREGLDGRCFHLTDPEPRRVGEILDIFARAGHAPKFVLRINPRLRELVPQSVRQGLALLTPVHRLQAALLRDLGLPAEAMRFVSYPTRFSNRETRKLLDAAGIRVPPLEGYAWKLWDYWERHLDPELRLDQGLASALGGKVVLITGAADGIGKATARKAAAAGATVLVVDRDQDRLDRMQAELAAQGWRLWFHRADLTDAAQVERLAAAVLEAFGAPDVLVNNAGHSIRRAIEHSYDRFHDFERVMALNYFGALRLTLALLPAMQQRRSGHVINISSLGVLTNAPRFSAYVASKAAMDAFARCAAAEFADSGIEFSTVYMPLVRTAMSAPTEVYRSVPMLSPDDAAALVAQAMVQRPAHLATPLGVFAQVLQLLSPHLAHAVMNISYRMFPESRRALGESGTPADATPEQLALARLMKGIHL